MGKLGLVKIRRFSGIFSLCLCLVLVGITVLSAAGRADAATATGSLPVIRVFTGDPLMLPDGGHVVYIFEVYDATKIQVVEAGEIINEYNGPPSTTNKGKASGRTTYQIRTAGMDTFDTILRASNPSGQREQRLSISFATKSELPPASLTPPVSDNGTVKRNKWGPQTSSPVSLTSPTTLPPRTGSPFVPAYAECPSGCNCLTPDQAAQYGFKQKCSEERCFSADKQVNSFCYNKSAGWCCKDGKVISATEAECKEAGGSYWSTDQAQVIEVCQPESGWCCVGGKVYQATKDKATQAGVTWYATEAEATKACISPGWCCRNGQLTQATQTQCVQSLTAAGGVWYATEAEAAKACQQACWCCASGRYGQTTSDACAKMGGTCYATQAQAQELCQSLGYCCRDGQVAGPISQTQCAQVAGAWYSTQAAAKQACQKTYYCCRNGQLYMSTTLGSGCYTSQTEAQRACQPTYYCCSNGQVYQSKTPGTGCYTTQAAAQQACQPTYWCCRNGQVYQSKTPGTGCYSTQAEATKACQRPLTTPLLQ